MTERKVTGTLDLNELLKSVPTKYLVEVLAQRQGVTEVIFSVDAGDKFSLRHELARYMPDTSLMIEPAPARVLVVID